MRKVLCHTICYMSLAFALVLGAGCNTTQTPEQQADDASITTAVKSQLAADVDLSTVTDIEINTTNGVVTLAGQVSSEALKMRAEEVAKRVEGVVRVTNNLQVQPPSEG